VVKIRFRLWGHGNLSSSKALILNDLKPVGTPDEGKHVVEIMEAAYESAKTGKTIKLKTS